VRPCQGELESFLDGVGRVLAFFAKEGKRHLCLVEAFEKPVILAFLV